MQTLVVLIILIINRTLPNEIKEGVLKPASMAMLDNVNEGERLNISRFCVNKLDKVASLVP